MSSEQRTPSRARKTVPQPNQAASEPQHQPTKQPGQHPPATPDQAGLRPAQTKITIPAAHPMVSVLGSGDSILRVIEKSFPEVDFHARGNEITASGPRAEVDLVERLFQEILIVLRTGVPLTDDTVARAVSALRSARDGAAVTMPSELLTQNILSNRGRTIRPKTVNQQQYVDAIDRNTVVFGIGPAGTGKTYLAMAKAVQALQAKEVSRIILTRPAVEAGERLGFLPGTLFEKIDPYLRPLYDALHDMIDPDSIPKLMAAGTIEVAPLAYMRGRAQPVFSKVLTPDGFRPIGDLTVGDLVIGSNGEPTPVLGVYPQGEKDIYRVTAQDGSSTLCCGEHLWTVRTASDRRRDKPWRVLETKAMIGKLGSARARRYELPMLSGPVCLPERDVPMDAYALGLLLGDGCLTGTTTPAFASADPELAFALEAALPGIVVRRESRVDYVLNRVREPGDVMTLENPVTGVLRRLNLLGTRSHAKFVPDEYLQNSAEVRLALLQGLLDSDGGPVTQAGRTCRIQYTTTSATLRDNVTTLVRSLGGVVYSRCRPAAGRMPGWANGRAAGYCHDAYIIDIRLPENIQPFRLARKLDKYRAMGGGRPTRFVDNIEPAGREQAVCIQVAAADSLYVTEDYLLTHNTLNDAFIILDEAQNTSAEQMKMFLTRLGFGSKIVVTGDVTQVDLPNGTESGLRVVQQILAGLDDIHFSQLTSVDVVRHRLVGEIVEAYGRFDAVKQAQQQALNGKTGQRGRTPGR